MENIKTLIQENKDCKMEKGVLCAQHGTMQNEKEKCADNNYNVDSSFSSNTDKLWRKRFCLWMVYP